MTDKEKLEKLRAEIERRYDKIIALPIGKDKRWEAIMGAKIATLHSLLSFIDSMQEEPKECIYSKDNYTDEDRKVLCDGCNEDCKYIPPVFDEGYWERLGEEPVSDDLEAEFLRAAHNLREQPTLSAWFKHFYNLGKQHNKKWLADNHKRIFNNGYEEGFEAGRDDMEEQLMANAVDGFVIEDIEEGNGDFLLSAEYLSKDMGLKDRQKVKVIVIKEN